MISRIRSNTFYLVLIIISATFFFTGCNTIDLYEKVMPIPSHSWKSNFKPKFVFTIKDTTSPYQLYIILRHNEKYNYNNIWLNLYAEGAGGAEEKFMLELPLASKDKGWLGVGMDDLYEHRIALTLDPQKFNFKRSGQYTFTLEQIMREDPLQNVMDIGLRLEKKPY
ncbi:MAG: gliding motility lipoprotein GldH [Flavisolibacter sp.]|jgi:gliding motility-associated lipoprotein GldH